MLKCAIAVAGLTASLFSAPFVAPAAADDTAPTRVEVKTVLGSGCPDGSANVRMTSANRFVISFSDFAAWTGAGESETNTRKNCQVALEVDAPEGATYSINRTTYRGFTYLSSAGSATASAQYYCQGSSDTKTATIKAFTGPTRAEWTSSATSGASASVRCQPNRLLNVNTELRVSPSPTDAFGVLGLESLEGTVTVNR
ncbi:MAG: hypothetical protein QG622_3181 [Actinomycetota bacterium]|nr:hypothetical protein [Actinomycetota bacterium]